jgi:hypothetical protein
LRTAAGLAALIMGLFAGSAAGGGEGFRPLLLAGHAVRWPGEAIVLRVGLVAGPVSFPDARNCQRMVPIDDLLDRSGLSERTFSAELDAALALWSAATRVRFEPVGPAEHADILIGAQADPEGFAFTNVVQGQGADADQIRSSTICLNPERRWKVGFDGDLDVFDLRYTLAHEIGHALGLDHPSRSGQLMSYRYDERFRDLQPGDLGGAVALYGAPGAPRGREPIDAAAPVQSTPRTGLAIARD